MKSLSAAALVVVALVSGVHAQTGGGTFEVASIKPSGPDAPRGGFGLMPGEAWPYRGSRSAWRTFMASAVLSSIAPG
jgi:hypothetical protein